MTSTLDRSPAAPDGSSRASTGTVRRQTRVPVVWIAAIGAVCVRLPLLSRPPSPDEAGFLIVGGQWHGGGTSLYGGYWVDRPPLLITLFRIAADAGGLVPLRLLGCVATVLTILGVAQLARQLGDRRAAGWAAVAAAVLLVSPLTGAQSVDGELLATPFVAWGLVAAVVALRGGPRSTLLAGAAGAALVCSAMVKQNFVDLAVFLVAAVGLALWRRQLTGSRARGLLVGFAIGLGAALAAMCLWTAANGTSIVGVYDAIFPFRVEAGRLLASPANHGSRARLAGMLVSWLLCGGALAMVATAWALWRRRLGGTLVWALVVTLCFDVVSVLAGGSYWHHYLLQLVVALSVLLGVAAGHAAWSARAVIAASVLAGAVAWTVALPWQSSSLAHSVGSAVGAASAPGDSIVTMYGHADVDQAAGLPSPYPYLWSLPTKARDPQLHTLADVLSGPTAPTWFVTWTHLSSWGVDSSIASPVLAARYHAVAHLEGHTVYLRNGVHRSAPALRGTVPRTPPRITKALEEFLP